MSPTDALGVVPRVGYVCKVYPRFSETFIVTEILAHERAGLDLEVFSLRPPVEGRFHESLADVRSSVTYLDTADGKLASAWPTLRAGCERLPGAAAAWPELFAADSRDALQAVELALAVVDRGLTHLHAHFASVATTVTRLAALAAGVGYSFTAHAKDIFHEDVDQDDLRHKLADATGAVTVSDFNVAHLREAFGAAVDVRRIYNGLDLSRFPFDQPAVRPPEIVAVGRLVEKKGFVDLADAVSLAAAERPQLHCTIIGTGPLEGQLRARIAALGVADRITLAGPLPQAAVRRVVREAAAFAAPCLVGDDGNRDGLPTALLEAMALGTPTIATDVTGIPEVLTDEVTGLMVAQRDPPALAAAMVRLVDDPELRCRLAEAARARIVEDFDADRQASRLRELFVSGARRGRAVVAVGS